MADASDDSRARADRRLDQALSDSSVRDPRPYFRHALRQLKQRNAAGYDRAAAYFEERLVPAVAGDADPLTAWLDYGRMIIDETGTGRVVEVGPSGRALAPDPDRPPQGMLLWLPDDDALSAVLLRAPARLSRAQEATIELLVEGKVTASAYARP